MRNVRSVVVAVVALCALVGCGAGGGDTLDAQGAPDAVPTSVATTDAPTSADEGGAVVAPDWDGPTTLITASLGNLVAVDLVNGVTTELAGGTALAESLGLPFGRFDGVDLSPDGSTVAFAFGGTDDDESSYGLYEVPADGSAEALRLSPAAAGSFASSPAYSPDGRRLAAYLDGQLVVFGEDRSVIGDGVDLAYPPNDLTWAPSGERLLWSAYLGRGPCCVIVTQPVDPATGELAPEATEAPSTGSPAYDGSGQLRPVPQEFQFDVEASGRFVVGSDDTPGELLWWTLDEDAPPQPLPLEIDLQEAPTVAAW